MQDWKANNSAQAEMLLTTILLGVLLFISFADAAIRNTLLRRKPRIPKITAPERSVLSINGTALPPLSTVYYFDQLIDHNKPGLGTFKQRYWFNYEYYRSGGPIVFLTPGEENAEGMLFQEAHPGHNSFDMFAGIIEAFLSNETILGLIAQQQNGAMVTIEHRFFGFSNPYPNLTLQSLEVLTIQQAIDDLVYFAQNVNLPMPGGDNVKPNTTPWALIGGSYAAALTSWTMVSYPGVFRAGYASSATVEAITDYYAYFTLTQKFMPQNCSSDIQAVVAYLDHIHAKNNTTAIRNLKDAFGLGGLSHIDDFAAALTDNLYDWQNIEPYSGPGGPFYQFCDALEVKDGVNAPPTGWGLDHAIDAWGSYWNNSYYASLCGDEDAEECLSTYNTSQPGWTNTTVDNDSRSWFWLVCNELGWYQVGPPPGYPAIASRIVRTTYWERQCVNMFPDKFSSPPSPSVDKLNKLYKGWDVNLDRMFFSNGLRDPWRDATVSADGLNKANTTTQPIYNTDANHISDMITENGQLDETVYIVQQAALKYMKEWLA